MVQPIIPFTIPPRPSDEQVKQRDELFKKSEPWYMFAPWRPFSK